MGDEDHVALGGRRLIDQRARAFDHVFDAVVVTDLEGRIVDWNAGAERLYGWPRDEILGEPVSVLHAPDDVEHLTAEVMEGIERDGKWQGEIRLLRRDGSTGYVESVVVPLIDDAGEVRGAIGINRDITARVEAERRLEYLAHHDPLTGLTNRALAMDRLARGLARARRTGGRVAVLFLDLDGFKLVNDEHGHAVGDAVLVEVGRRLLAELREVDTVARFGGDEFLVVLESVRDREEAEQTVARLRASLLEPMPSPVDRPVGVSVGLALFPEDGDEPEVLVSLADDDMYRHKADHRGRRR